MQRNRTVSREGNGPVFCVGNIRKSAVLRRLSYMAGRGKSLPCLIVCSEKMPKSITFVHGVNDYDSFYREKH
jgi:hypothetical protein